MDASNYFPFDVDPNLISVYIGRVISLDPDFGSNGILYVDIFDPDDTDLDKGSRHSNQATASYAVRSCYNAWENPPEIKSKTQFDGAMTFTSSGDFHLRNYCFDMVTQTWFMTVSTLLNMFGIVNVPPVMVSLDTTPFPGQAVSVNVSVAAKEVVNESIQSCLKDLVSEERPAAPDIVSLEEVKEAVEGATRTRSLRSGPSTSDSNNPVIKVVKNIVNPIVNLLDVAVKPYFEFIECIEVLLEIYEKELDNIENITFPITQFAEISDDGTASAPSPLSALAIKDALKSKIETFKNSVADKIDEVKSSVLDEVIELVYNPIASLYMMVDSKIQDVVNPIKNKVVELIGNYVKDPLSQLTGLIAMSIQPVISSLPTIVQLVVKMALKKLLQLLLGLPIKTILGVIIDSIEKLLDTAVSKLEDMVGQVINTAINTLINPVIGVMQKALISIVPVFNVDDLVTKLEEIKNDITAFPPIYIGSDAIKPYKDFLEIDWSNSKELKALLVSLIGLIPSKKISDIPELANQMVQKSVEQIYQYKNESGKKFIQGFVQKCKESIEITDINGARIDIPVDSNLPEGTLTSNGKELYYKKFSSKEEFLPIFEQIHEIKKDKAQIGVGIFEKPSPKEWLTNKIGYLDVPDNGSTIRYITYCNIDGVTTGRQQVPALYNKEDGTTELVNVSLELNKVYYSTTVPHIKDNDGDTTQGEDLIPIAEKKVHGGIITYEAKCVEIPKTVQSGAEVGEILYQDYDPDTGEPNGEKTFNQITFEHYQIPVENTISLSTLGSNIKKVFNGSISDWNSFNPSIFKSTFKNTELYKCLRSESSTNYSNDIKEVVIVEDDEGNTHKENKSLNITFDDIDTSSSYSYDLSLDSNNGVFTIKYYKKIGTTSVGANDIRINIECSIKNNVITTIAFTVLQRPILKEITVFPPYQESVWPDTNNIKLTGLLNSPDKKSTNYYTWMTSSVEEVPVDVSTLVNENSVHDQLADMLVHTVEAIGQDGDFNSDSLFDAIKGKALSVFGDISDAVSGVDSILSSTLERIDELKKAGDFVDKIAEIGDKVQDVADKAGPALEAVAKAASAVAIQSCSMSQSATGKDFSFNSGEGYDLSTTTEARSQLPWCKELNREQFLEPNCKVLIMAVGAGKNNLYVIDILT